MMSKRQGALVLADGSCFRGQAIGALQQRVGEVVFNTTLTGYQEVLSDPSYSQQIVCFTAPHIGNTGVNSADDESRKPLLQGAVWRNYSPLVSSWRSEGSVEEYLQHHGVAALVGVDSRRLTRHLRTAGAQPGCLISADARDDLDIAAAQQAAQEFVSMQGRDLASSAGVKRSFCWHNGGSWDVAKQGYRDAPESHFHVLAYDFGAKTNLFRLLSERCCKVTVVPPSTSAKEALKKRPDGIFFSNGPGDPAACDNIIAVVRELLAAAIPMFGICFGYQILALACGARSEKLCFGHHGANHPVLEKSTGKVLITSQNHGFAIAAHNLPQSLRASHFSLFDGSLQGVRGVDLPLLGFQGHPEASPGPQDVQYLFDQFIALIRQSQAAVGA